MTTQSKIKLAQLFNSFEGEFPKAGEYATFVRFYKCNLSCPWCDTMTKPYIRNPQEYSFEDIIRLIKETHNLTFTGGEPTLPEFLATCEKIIDKIIDEEIFVNYIKFETNGTNLQSLYMFIEKFANKISFSFAKRFIVCWSPKFYNESVSKKSFITLIEKFNPTNTYIKIVMDPKRKKQIHHFLSKIKEYYGLKGLKQTALMPLSTKDTKSFNEESLNLCLTYCKEFSLNVTTRIHQIFNIE